MLRRMKERRTLRTLDRRMRKLRREYRRALSWGYNWLGTQISKEIEVLAAQIEREIERQRTPTREWPEG